MKYAGLEYFRPEPDFRLWNLRFPIYKSIENAVFML